MHNPLDESYIAPRRSGFEALVRAIGAPELLGKFDDLATVRIAHQQAGEEIRRQLLELLDDRAWVADVDEDGWTVLHAGELGSLLLAVVTARLDEPVTVPRMWLGAAIDEAGRRGHRAHGKGGAVMTPQETRDLIIDAVRRDLLGPLADADGTYPGAARCPAGARTGHRAEERPEPFVRRRRRRRDPRRAADGALHRRGSVPAAASDDELTSTPSKHRRCPPRATPVTRCRGGAAAGEARTRRRRRGPPALMKPH
ncbi:hypothetical protein MSM1_20025 [Mycobacterium sp. SM1]|uniref:hypothetical protein n=1 Tax=Mycobacterium sp. SM1 TaxID=2816243 RepID=UPI001BCF71E6|nr:hypothetical protein [Mycobacterium sp. SM1]MBS4730511.1 hypothetical protein [Mycobacterium sp. SM1]